RAALALAVPGGPAEQLGHHHPRVCPSGQGVGVIAVGPELVVVRTEGLGGPDRDRLLPDVQVAEAVDFSLLVGLCGPFLEAPDQVHLPVHRQELVLGELRCHAAGLHIDSSPGFPRDPGMARRGARFTGFQASAGSSARCGTTLTLGASVDTRPECPVATSTTSASGNVSRKSFTWPGSLSKAATTLPSEASRACADRLNASSLTDGSSGFIQSWPPAPGNGKPNRRRTSSVPGRIRSGRAVR